MKTVLDVGIAEWLQYSHSNGQGKPGELVYHSCVIVILLDLSNSITVELSKGISPSLWSRVNEPILSLWSRVNV